MSQTPRPLFVVCEDGQEYTERFERFLAREFRFVRAGDWREAEAALEAARPRGLLLDLDFRRLEPDQLLGEEGPPAFRPSREQRAHWSATQGILILRYLRTRGMSVPALLFADLDDAGQIAYLEQRLAPLSVVGSREGLRQLAARLRAF